MDITVYQNTDCYVEAEEFDISDVTATEEYAERQLCLLEEDDVQCGHIFFNEQTRMLKFFCTYCREIYDNVNYYCEHLSEHINEENAQHVEGTLSSELEEEVSGSVVEFAHNTTGESEYERVCASAQQYESCNETTVQATSDLELESDEIVAEVEEEMRYTYADDNSCVGEENSCDDFLGYDEEDALPIGEHVVTERSQHQPDEPFVQEHAMQAATDFESMIDATSIGEEVPKALTARKKKNKKVTTVKVIAIKNRIAELYDRIKTEEEKRSQLLGVSAAINRDAEGNEEQADLQELLHSGTEGGADVSVSGVQPKIIGETLITLLPKTSGDLMRSTSPKESSSDTKAADTFSQSIKQHRRECVCPACGLRFRSSFSLSIHKRSHYLESKSDIKLAHKCSNCDQLFNKIPELKEHLQKVHYPDGFICRICNKRLTSLTLLEKHMRAVHLTRPFSCKICQKSFDSRTAFEAHVDNHIEGQSNHKCRVCGRKYSSEAALHHHMNNHKEQKPQCCVVCGKMTLRITQHMKIHTPRPKRILSCSACGKVFNFSSGLSHHFKIMHKFPRPPPKPKKEILTISNKRKRKPRAAAQHKDIKSEPQQEQLPQQEQTTQQLKVDYEEVYAKEEEAKRVIVELIQNASYTSAAFLTDSNINEFEVTAPPIAREETISAVNSIVNDC